MKVPAPPSSSGPSVSYNRPGRKSEVVTVEDSATSTSVSIPSRKSKIETVRINVLAEKYLSSLGFEMQLSGQDTKAADELSGQNLSQYIPNRLSPLKPREHQSSRLPSAALSSGARIVNSHVEFAHPKDMTALQVSVSPLLSQNQRLVNNYLFLRVYHFY